MSHTKDAALPAHLARGASLDIQDPMTAPVYPDGWISRWCKSALFDPRDEVFVRLLLRTVPLMASAMIVLLAAFHRGMGWKLVPLYFGLWAWSVPPVILMLHCTMHRPFIKSPKRLGRALPYAMSFLFGIPTAYAQHHTGMHHIEDNMPDDVSSTMRFRRDSFLHFLVYFARFLSIAVDLGLYFHRKQRMSTYRRAIRGEIAHWLVIGAGCALDWRFGLVAFALPYFVVRFMMMVGNWGQHAFLNTALENNGMSNAVTCINSSYNRRCFNDGYHIGHHMKAIRHWTEMPKDFLDNLEVYRRADCVVFEGLDFFFVSVLLWTGQWRVLAKRFVRLDGKERSDEDVIAMLKSRVQPVRLGATAPNPAEA